MADELAEEGWIDAEEAEDSPPDFYSGLRTDDTASSCHCSQIAEGIRVSSPSNSPQNKNGSINSTGSNKAEGCTRLKGNDGSDYGEESNSDEGGDVLPALEAQGALIESLAWHYDASFDSDAFIRMTTQLKELGSQVNIENHIMRSVCSRIYHVVLRGNRLATSHMALTAHVARQGRALTSLMHPLVSPLAVPPSVETIDSLLPVISSLILSLPQPCESALPSIHALHHGSIDVLSSLSYLSDNLYMTRQTTTLATRRLRTAREVAGTMKQEIDKAEEGERWLEVGSWALKLRRREAARVCREVVEGFDEVLKGHRKRLEMDVVV